MGSRHRSRTATVRERPGVVSGPLPDGRGTAINGLNGK